MKEKEGERKHEIEKQKVGLKEKEGENKYAQHVGDQLGKQYQHEDDLKFKENELERKYADKNRERDYQAKENELKRQHREHLQTLMYNQRLAEKEKMLQAANERADKIEEGKWNRTLLGAGVGALGVGLPLVFTLFKDKEKDRLNPQDMITDAFRQSFVNNF